MNHIVLLTIPIAERYFNMVIIVPGLCSSCSARLLFRRTLSIASVTVQIDFLNSMHMVFISLRTIRLTVGTLG